LERTAAKEVVASAPMPSNPIAPPTYQRFPQPSVDGKVVSMFRRLGTTLSREQPTASSPESTTSTTTKPPQIMSPLKEVPRWTRDLDEDEILLEFDSAISEVLPTTSYQVTQGENKENQRAEEMELEEENQAELEVVQEAEADAPLEPPSHRSSSNSSHHQNSHQVSLQLSGLRLPLGLSISLV